MPERVKSKPEKPQEFLDFIGDWADEIVSRVVSIVPFMKDEELFESFKKRKK